MVSLCEQGVTSLSITEEKYKNQFEKEYAQLRVNTVITFPGVPKRQMQLGMNASILSEHERRIIRILGVHRAIARNGILIELPCAKESFRMAQPPQSRCKHLDSSHLPGGAYLLR